VKLDKGPISSNFMIDTEGNLIIKMNNLFFRYNMTNVSSEYNGNI